MHDHRHGDEQRLDDVFPSLSGLGQQTLNVNVTVSGFALYQCQNGGGNTAPGQNEVQVGPVTAPTTIPADQIKNGNVSFTSNPPS